MEAEITGENFKSTPRMRKHPRITFEHDDTREILNISMGDANIINKTINRKCKNLILEMRKRKFQVNRQRVPNEK